MEIDSEGWTINDKIKVDKNGQVMSNIFTRNNLTREGKIGQILIEAKRPSPSKPKSDGENRAASNMEFVQLYLWTIEKKKHQ